MSGQASARRMPVAVSRWSPFVARLDRSAGAVFILPAVLVILTFSIFPLLASLYVSLTRLTFSEGGVHLSFVGLNNYAKLVVGIDRTHFIGVTVPLTPVTGAVLAVVYGGFAFLLIRYLRGPGATVLGFVGRLFTAVIAGGLIWLVVDTVLTSGRPGTLVVTLIYVSVDVSVQYLLALGLAVLVVQHIPGRRFFRVVFLLPMMITPVGVAYLFRMPTDTARDLDRRADPAHRGVQDRRPAERAHERRPRNGHGIAHAPRLHDLAGARHRGLGRRRLHAALRRDLRRHHLRQSLPPSSDGDGLGHGGQTGANPILFDPSAFAGRDGRLVSAPVRLGARCSVPPLLARHHLGEDTSRRQRRSVLFPVS